VTSAGRVRRDGVLPVWRPLRRRRVRVHEVSASRVRPAGGWLRRRSPAAPSPCADPPHRPGRRRRRAAGDAAGPAHASKKQWSGRGPADQLPGRGPPARNAGGRSARGQGWPPAVLLACRVNALPPADDGAHARCLGPEGGEIRKATATSVDCCALRPHGGMWSMQEPCSLSPAEDSQGRRPFDCGAPPSPTAEHRLAIAPGSAGRRINRRRGVGILALVPASRPRG
jgi:hypothetical protein